MEIKINRKNIKDLGIRANYSGELYIDKNVFFNREDVKNLLERLKKIKWKNRLMK